MYKTSRAREYDGFGGSRIMSSAMHAASITLCKTRVTHHASEKEIKHTGVLMHALNHMGQKKARCLFRRFRAAVAPPLQGTVEGPLPCWRSPGLSTNQRMNTGSQPRRRNSTDITSPRYTPLPLLLHAWIDCEKRKESRRGWPRKKQLKNTTGKCSQIFNG